MNKIFKTKPRGVALAAVLLVPMVALFAQAQDKNPSAKAPVYDYAPAGEGLETGMDLPGDFHKYYGQRVNSWRDSEKKIAKLDLDADMNYDGTIDNDDPSDNGAFQQTPPGLVVGKGELSKFIIRLDPYRVDFLGEVVVSLEVAGINRANRNGTFESLDQELASVGHIRVWRDASKTTLLLDSSDPNMRYCEFVVDQTVYPANLPGIVPRTVYVEGLSASPQFLGDIRLLTTVSHRKRGGERGVPYVYEDPKGVVTEQPAPAAGPESGPRFLKRFRTSFDHILLTVTDFPAQKEYINNNAEGVWIAPAAGKGGK
jgi:hypothetical protein